MDKGQIYILEKISPFYHIPSIGDVFNCEFRIILESIPTRKSRPYTQHTGSHLLKLLWTITHRSLKRATPTKHRAVIKYHLKPPPPPPLHLLMLFLGELTPTCLQLKNARPASTVTSRTSAASLAAREATSLCPISRSTNDPTQKTFFAVIRLALENMSRQRTELSTRSLRMVKARTTPATYARTLLIIKNT